jgi:hypothetical protein
MLGCTTSTKAFGQCILEIARNFHNNILKKQNEPGKNESSHKFVSNSSQKYHTIPFILNGS